MSAMTERCDCSDQGDPIVFGPCKKCHPVPQEPREPRWRDTLGEDETHD